MSERDEIFRGRLIALMGDLNAGGSRDPQLRKVLGRIALKLYTDGGARNWADLKERADGPTYDSLLRLFQKQTELANKQGDATTVTAVELLGISLIARRQYQTDLEPGVAYLDQFIEEVANYERNGGMKLHIPAKGRR